MVWDNGTYDTEPQDSATKQLAQGELKFTLHGKKLRGRFVLIRTGLKSSGSRRQRSWLLIKRQDGYADRSWNIDRYDWSVLTGRSLEEVAAGVSVDEGPGRLRIQEGPLINFNRYSMFSFPFGVRHFPK